MKKILTTVLFTAAIPLMAQVQRVAEMPPVLPGCEGQEQAAAQVCFNEKVETIVYDNFKLPDDQADFKGKISVLFEVTDKGTFNVLFVDAADAEIAAEARRVFSLMPKAAPSTYNGNPTYAKYTFTISVPRQTPGMVADNTSVAATQEPVYSDFRHDKELTEFDSVKKYPFRNPQYKSHLNVPFSHSMYAWFDAQVNQVGSNNHTGSKPYTYADVAPYYDFDAANATLRKPRENWWGKKLWNEDLVAFQGEGYWLTLNPIFDLQIGKDADSDLNYTYVNTRGLQFQGGLGEQVNFSTTIYESQGRFADYYNAYAESLAPAGGNPAIIPGIGIAKRFKTDSYDFPLAEANLSYTPNKFFNLQLGYGRNFIGDGYRSLLEGDGAAPYPYFKLNTTFWKIKYTNTYMWLKDVRPEVTADRTYAKKYMANHYLSWNMTKRLNMGFFESVVWADTNDRGFDMSFANPIIFYRSVEFASSARSGNALLGLTMKYKVRNDINLYGQFLLDEFSLNDVKAGNQSWKNKFGYQVGGKYFNAFGVKNLLLQGEYNHVRPYVYAHSDPLTNYGHDNQSMGHQWGGNFDEVIAIARYHHGRWFGDAKVTFGRRGLDFDTADNSYNYGGNIYKSYEDDRPFNTGVKVGQGNRTDVFIVDAQAGYLVNPATSLKLFASVIYRNFDPSQETESTFKNSTTWFSVGLRCDVFNWYFDY